MIEVGRNREEKERTRKNEEIANEKRRIKKDNVIASRN